MLLLSRFSRVRLCATHQTPLSPGFSKQEHWSGLPLPSPTHESEKWKWSHSVVSDSLRHHGLQPTRLLRPWDFPGKSTGVGCHCLLQSCSKGHLQIAETSTVESVKCQAIYIQIFVVNISFPSRKLAAFHQEEFLHLPSWNKFHTHKYLHSLLWFAFRKDPGIHHGDS